MGFIKTNPSDPKIHILMFNKNTEMFRKKNHVYLLLSPPSAPKCSIITVYITVILDTVSQLEII